MKQLSFTIAAFLFITISNAQFISDAASNRPFYKLPENIDGNPFYNTNWSNGTIRTERGVEYSNLLLKYDVYNGELVFKVNDSMYRFTEPVKEFVLTNNSGSKTTVSKFIKSSLVHNLLPPTFVQELAAGKINLYKHYKKVVVELAAYNSVGKKQLEDKITYYLIRDNILTPVVFNKKKAEEIFKDKWAQVSAYMEQNQLSAKNEAGWVAAVTYYNSL